MDAKESNAHAAGPALALDSKHFETCGLLLRAMMSGAHAVSCMVRGENYDKCALRTFQTILVLAAFAGAHLPRCSARHASGFAVLSSIVWSGCLIWGLQWGRKALGQGVLLAGESFTAMVVDVSLIILFVEYLSFFTQPRLRFACIACHVLNCAAFIAVFRHRMDMTVDIAVVEVEKICVFMSFAWHIFFNHRRLHRQLLSLNQQLVAEQAATSALLKMTSDAGFWVAADGDTIVKGDRSLDMIMGAAMESTRLSACLSDPDREKFCDAIAQADDSVKLLPVTILPPGAQPLEAELFVVAVGAHARGRFLIGLRLSETWELAASDIRRSSAARAEGRREHCAPRSLSASEPASPLGAMGTASQADATIARQDLTELAERDIEAGSFTTYPTTLASHALEPMQERTCRKASVTGTLLSFGAARDSRFAETIDAAIALCFEHAQGGALILIATKGAFADIFDNASLDARAHSTPSLGPTLRTSDGGYMTTRLRGVHVRDQLFAAAFRDFTEPSRTDRWPQDYPDVAARGLPKDGAFLLNPAGFRLMCAVKAVGLAPPRSWQGVGTRHEAASACAWAVKGCVALVRSDAGTVHAIVRDAASLLAYRVLPE